MEMRGRMRTTIPWVYQDQPRMPASHLNEGLGRHFPTSGVSINDTSLGCPAGT